MSWNKRVERAAHAVVSSGLSVAHDADEVVAMVKGMADGLADPTAGWFVADVLNEVNELEMELEG